MKKYIACILILILSAAVCMPAAAAGRGLTVVSENVVIEEKDDGVNVFVFARLTNTSKDTVTLDTGLFEVKDTAGNLIGTDDAPAVYAAKYLKLNEQGYLRACVSLEGFKKEQIGACTLTVNGKVYKGRARIERFACEPVYEEDVVYGGWLTYDYMGATVTNNTDAVLYDLETVFALCDKDGKILNIGYAFMGLLNDIGLHPGSTVTMRDINADTVQAAYTASGDVPAYVDAIAYREIYV